MEKVHEQVVKHNVRLTRNTEEVKQMLSQRRKEQSGPIYSKWGKRQGEVKKKKKRKEHMTFKITQEVTKQEIANSGEKFYNNP